MHLVDESIRMTLQEFHALKERSRLLGKVESKTAIAGDRDWRLLRGIVGCFVVLAVVELKVPGHQTGLHILEHHQRVDVAQTRSVSAGGTALDRDHADFQMPTGPAMRTKLHVDLVHRVDQIILDLDVLGGEQQVVVRTGLSHVAADGDLA